MHDSLEIMFSTNLQDILENIEKIDAVAYAKTRNYVHGAVTRLSPYITHGVVSLPYIAKSVLQKYSLQQSEKLLQELAWREFFKRVWEEKDYQIFTELRFTQDAISPQIPTTVLTGETGIIAIDAAIRNLFAQGYMHNHERLWLASIVCNIAKTHWRIPSQWLYYHLLDGDLASNSLSWQWVAGTFSHKKYFANQENINTYSQSVQRSTFLDYSYEELEHMAIPSILTDRSHCTLQTTLPKNTIPQIQQNDIVQLYHPFTLNYQWKIPECNRAILLLEPSHFTQYPISPKRLEFIIELAKNIIPHATVVTAELTDLPPAKYYALEHPLTKHWKAERKKQEYLFPAVTGYFKNFFSYWQECQKHLSTLHKRLQQH